MGVIGRALSMLFPVYPNRRWPVFGRLGDERSYESLVGDGSGSTIVDDCISFILSGFWKSYPTVAVSEPYEQDPIEMRADHPAALLFRRPVYEKAMLQSWYSWRTMIAGLLTSYCLDANAYLLKVRGAGGYGDPVQLWYTPHYMLEPRWDVNDPTRFITHYDYAPKGTYLTEGPQSVARLDGPVYPVRPQDVVHLRDGLDTNNPRKGMNKVKRLLREIFTDEQAARFTASVLMNHGAPGVIISPDGGIAMQDDAIEVKERFRAAFAGDHAGEALVLKGPSKVTEFGWSPDKMLLKDIRSIPEERICAAFGLSAVVVGLGAGLERVRVGRTLEEFVDLSWQNGILNRMDNIAGELTEQLITEWDPQEAARTLDFRFDVSRVPIMAQYHKTVAETQAAIFTGGLGERGEGRHALGLPVSKRDKVMLVPSGTQEVPSDKTPEEAPAGGQQTPSSPADDPSGASTSPAKPAANGNGNGKVVTAHSIKRDTQEVQV